GWARRARSPSPQGAPQHALQRRRGRATVETKVGEIIEVRTFEVQSRTSGTYDARSALTMLRRAARTAGRNPPITPITTAKTRARVITPGDNANPKPISDKLWKLTTEIRSKDRRAASATPSAPPTSASTTDSTKNAPKTLRRRNPRARSVPTSTVRFATTAYMVIIAPIIAPKLKMVVTTRPRIRMNFASVCDCSL